MAQWYYSQYSQQLGPVETAELAHKLASGVIKPNDLVWREGMAHWAHAGTLPELKPPAPATNPSPVASPAQTPAAPSAGQPSAQPAYVPQYYTPQPYPTSEPLPQSGLGAASFIIAIIVVVIETASVAAAVMAGSHQNLSASPAPGLHVTLTAAKTTSNNPGELLAGSGICLGIFLALIGLIIGLFAFSQQRRRTFVWLGVIINGTIILGIVALILIGLAVK